MSEATKSGRVCKRCGTSDLVIRLEWEDDCGGPTIYHDDHVCLGCGLYANGSGCSLCAESLEGYWREYGHAVAPIKRFLDMLWASLPEEWQTEALLGGDGAHVEVRFVNTRDGREFLHRFDTASIARHRDDIGRWASQRAKAILRKKGQ